MVNIQPWSYRFLIPPTLGRDSLQLGKLNFYTPTQVPCTSPNSQSVCLSSTSLAIDARYEWPPFRFHVTSDGRFSFSYFLTPPQSVHLNPPASSYTHEKDNDNFFIAFVRPFFPQNAVDPHLTDHYFTPFWLTRTCSPWRVVIFIDIISVMEVDKLGT